MESRKVFALVPENALLLKGMKAGRGSYFISSLTRTVYERQIRRALMDD